MSYDEFFQWMEYYNKEPFEADRNEIQMANLSSIVVGLTGKSKLKTKDFMISKYDEDKPTKKGLQDKIKSMFGVFKNG